MGETVRHICGISGGKDSSALAVYLRGEIPEMEYFFCDTGAELQKPTSTSPVSKRFLASPLLA